MRPSSSERGEKGKFHQHPPLPINTRSKPQISPLPFPREPAPGLAHNKC